jgi:parallel beta helix pectate lyase-like protein
MRRFVPPIMAVFGIILSIALYAAPAHAQATRTWVSGVGDDANPCSRTAPCKTFAGAISKTAPAGEINCLDPGGFGALTITKSISIICQAGTAGVLVSGTNGITISAGTTDQVYLSGLDFEGINSGLSGVQVNTAGAVHIVNCIIRGFNIAGVNIANSTSPVKVDVIDTVISDNTGTGLLAKPSGSVGTRVVVDRTRVFSNGGDGIMANGTVTTGSLKMSVRDSESAHNAGDGYVAFSSGAVSEVNIDSSTALDNNRGINASGSGATVRFTRTNVTANATGVNQVAPGAALSYSTNSVDGNATDGTFGTIAQK